MARTIPHRELRNNSSAVLRDVQAGESIAISNHGEIVAVLVPPTSRRSSLRVRRARVRGGFAELERVRLDTPVQPILDDLRGER
ncbi:type II toxin-antitoxin system Phd/YefM family antitoxin [Jiangella rhizosphaerae]|uniref:Antitoxin n=1 Tax=Jiangella rhizosphaerae TaxID=2293569 RepID=A0A418KRN8_9ACTN|nr:type II toxin-antitoxin system prevent-host-death family antitoxin [Jiangella rhizosphaerae]RIQ23910.1 type II toxin-antitoxin system prevent-host-death family antitoxin [Jiangella rhizosphaerae]